MKECKTCEMAVYCFSDPNTWIFRTKKEMDEKQAEITACPTYRKNIACSSHGSQSSHGASAAGK